MACGARQVLRNCYALLYLLSARLFTRQCQLSFFLCVQAPAPGMEASCTLSTELEEGPYYLDDILFRSNITEDQTGIPLILRIKVVNTDCEPLVDTFVDVWHCNGTGFYSGFTCEASNLLHTARNCIVCLHATLGPLPIRPT